jgi:hypothetical protein
VKKIFYYDFGVIIVAMILTKIISPPILLNESQALVSSQNIIFTVIFNNFNNPQGSSLLENAIAMMRSNYPNLNINVRYIETSDHPLIPNTPGTYNEILNSISNRPSADIVTPANLARRVCSK